MASGAEHYRAAEKLLSEASMQRSETDPTPLLSPDVQQSLTARALAHAKLAEVCAILDTAFDVDPSAAQGWRDAGAIR